MKSLVQSARAPIQPFFHKKKPTELECPLDSLIKVQSPSGGTHHQAFGRSPTVKTLNSDRDPIELTITLMFNE